MVSEKIMAANEAALLLRRGIHGTGGRGLPPQGPGECPAAVEAVSALRRSGLTMP